MQGPSTPCCSSNPGDGRRVDKAGARKKHADANRRATGKNGKAPNALGIRGLSLRTTSIGPPAGCLAATPGAWLDRHGSSCGLRDAILADRCAVAKQNFRTHMAPELAQQEDRSHWIQL